jgi:hypothetical protein
VVGEPVEVGLLALDGGQQVLDLGLHGGEGGEDVGVDVRGPQYCWAGGRGRHAWGSFVSGP